MSIYDKNSKNSAYDELVENRSNPSARFEHEPGAYAFDHRYGLDGSWENYAHTLDHSPTRADKEMWENRGR